jgi:hypothetical protein
MHALKEIAMDRAQGELLVKAEEYIQNNVTVGEFLDRIEPMIPRDASRRLHALLDEYLSDPMPDVPDASPLPT